MCALIGTIYNGGGGGVKVCVHSLALLQWRRGRGEGVCALIGTIYNGGGGGVKGCVHSLALSTMEEG